MDIKDLKSKVDSFNDSLDNIERNRKQWKDSTKPLIIKTFKEIIQQFPIGWNIQFIDNFENLEGVNLYFGAIPSGIKLITDDKAKRFIKTGGALTFSQSFNGEIYVIVYYPIIDELVGEKKPEKLGKYKPELITKKLIIEKVSKFLDKMESWESSIHIETVGFKRNNE